MSDRDSISKQDYDKYIQSPAWQQKRSERLKIDNYTCQRCGSRTCLDVHHTDYANFKNEDVYRDLLTLCRTCHEEVEVGKGMYTYKNKIARYEMILRELMARDFSREHEKDDLSGGGKINFCKNEVIRLMLTEYQKEQGLEDIGLNVKQVNDYFRDKRYEVMEKLLAENPKISTWQMSETTGFKYQMVDRFLKKKRC